MTRLNSNTENNQICKFDLSQLWVSTTEVAKLTGKSEQSIRKACAQSNGKYRGGQYIFKKDGRNYEILLESIPNDAQINYLSTHQKTLKKSVSSELVVKNTPVGYSFELYQMMAVEYETKCQSVKQEAENRLKVLREYSALIDMKLTKGQAETQIQSIHGVSKATLWRWKKMVEGHDRAYWLYLLAPSYDGRPKNEIHPEAWAHYCSLYGEQSKPPASAVYCQLREISKNKDWGLIPSLKTFQREWEKLPEDYKIFTREGETKLKEKQLSVKRDYTSIRIHQYWEADGRLADGLFTWADGSVSRPWIVLIREVRTRQPLAVRISPYNDSALVMETFRAAVLLSGTYPEEFIIDNGTEYSTKAFAGMQRSDVRHKNTQKEPYGLLARLGIKIHWATPFHGQAKPIESFWNVVAMHCDQTFGKAYVGNNPVNRPEYTHKKHAVPIEDYSQKLIDTLVRWSKGEISPHRGHGMLGKSPLELYEILNAEYQQSDNFRRPTTEHINSMRVLIFKRTFSPKRVFEITLKGFGKVEYEAAENQSLRIGFEYDILPDSSDPTQPALIYDGSRFMGEAVYKSHVPFDTNHIDGFQNPNKRRQTLIKRARADHKAINDMASAAPIPISYTSIPLPEVSSSQIVLDKATEPVLIESPITTLNDGTILNKVTGESIKPIDYQIKPIIEEGDTALTQLEAMRRNKEYLDAPDWQKEMIDPERYQAEIALKKRIS